ncbi:hypothetical protein D3C72_356130 [compost metagenome]
MPRTENIYVAFDESSLSIVEVTRLRENEYRLEQSLLFADENDPAFGDVIEVAPLEDESRFGSCPREAPCYRLLRVLEKAPFNHYMWVVSPQIAESVELKLFGDAVLEAGGHCDRVAGGVLMVSLPKGSPFDPEEALDRVTQDVLGPKPETRRYD